ncbi:unnamed protein product [Rodentolepis nana]|uniref:Enhancer of polycomb-like protein n=1 Tax=Rodentolepis nana TaxID=102285 RepID=A0A0R3TSX9_RODNA|nr:unnamed protein product [Rodentolepis nana]
MSKVSFRTRQIDYNRTLSIIRYDSQQYQELGEGAFVSRGVPTVPSGMEREEENEHHFIEVLQAMQRQKTSEVSIPVPEIIEMNEEYESTYTADFAIPDNLIHVCTAFLNDDEQIEYDMDAEDERWLSRSGLDLTPSGFEYMIERMERNCSQKKWLTLDDVKHILQDFSMRDIIAVYDYWLEKRLRHPKPLIPMILQEKKDGSTNDAYVAFRRRTERMQTRKNRKNEEYSYERMLIFQLINHKGKKIPKRIVEREMCKADLIDIDRQMFKLRYQSEDWDGSLLEESNAIASRSPRSFTVEYADKHLMSRKRKSSPRSYLRTPFDNVEVAEPKDKEVELFPFIRLPGCKYQKPMNYEADEGAGGGYSLSQVERVHRSVRYRHTGYMRQRFGRGGRRRIDRMQLSPATVDTNRYLPNSSSQSQPEIQVVELQHFPSSGISLPHRCNDSTLNATPLSRIHPSLSTPSFTSFDSFLRGLSKDQLAHYLKCLMNGNCLVSAADSRPAHRNSIYSSPVQKISDSVDASPSPSYQKLEGKQLTVVSKPNYRSTTGGSNHRLSVNSNSDNNVGAPLQPAVASAKGRIVPMPLTNGRGSANSSPKKALVNGGGTSPYIDGNLTRLPATTTPVRKSSALATMVKNSNSHHEDGTTAASTDGKSIIHPVVYNV